MFDSMILVLEFGGKEGRALARKVRGEKVYCEVLPAASPLEEIARRSPKGILLVGTPEEECAADTAIFSMGIPILAMGRSAKCVAEAFGGQFLSTMPEMRGASDVRFGQCRLFEALEESERYFSCVDRFSLPEEKFTEIAWAQDDVPVAFAVNDLPIFGTQFGIEQNDPDGLRILHNFCVEIAGAKTDWTMEAYAEQAIREIRETVSDRSVLMAVTGGVDSAVTAALIHRAIGERLQCLHIDTGLLRQGEGEFVARVFRTNMGVNLQTTTASKRFLACLQGITDPAAKRTAIEDAFAAVCREEAERFGITDCIAVGTIYTDILDGSALKTLSAAFEGATLLEPIRCLFKSEVRELGEYLGLPPEMVHRQSFPGAGFAVRIDGEATADRIAMLRAADAIYLEEIALAGLERRIWQCYAVLYAEDIVALRALNGIAVDKWMAYRLPYDLLERVVSRILEEISGVDRVMYDATPRQPAVPEWI